MSIFINHYGRCPLCGRMHDDGMILDLNGKRYFICLDCSEEATSEEILKRIREKEKDGTIYQ